MRNIIELTELVKETCRQIKTADISLEGSGDNLDVIVNTLSHYNVGDFILQITYYHYSSGLLLANSKLHLSSRGTFRYSHETKVKINLKPTNDIWFSHINQHNIMSFGAWDRMMRKCLGQ